MWQSVTRALAAFWITLVILPGLVQAAQVQDPTTSCQVELQAAETRYHMPPGLLTSMARVESGRPDPATGALAAWPWTIQTQGQGHFYRTAAEAVRDVKVQLKQGNGFVDVGCLQVDLFHHPDAFPTLDAAFDPATNVDYAARYLVSLAQARGSWLEAVAAYNAGDPAFGLPYLAKVLYLWKGVRLPAPAPVAPRPAFLITALP